MFLPNDVELMPLRYSQGESQGKHQFYAPRHRRRTLDLIQGDWTFSPFEKRWCKAVRNCLKAKLNQTPCSLKGVKCCFYRTDD